ncbi:unknown [Bacteroides sp. CAG:1060]|nr:unknown [Bacteroides sp. CAG:1060]
MDSRIALASRPSTSFAPKSTHFCSSSASMRTASNLRLSPLTNSLTVPLTGDARRMSGFFLSAMTGEPQSTVSPSLTRSLGRSPLMSVGQTATMPGAIALETRSSASPAIGMFRPFFKTMFFDIEYNVIMNCQNCDAKILIFFVISRCYER